MADRTAAGRDRLPGAATARIVALAVPQVIPLAILRAILLAILGAGALPAQNAWDIPHRGAIVYDREVRTFAVSPPQSRLDGDVVVAGAERGGHDWRYWSGPTKSAPAGFEQPGFNDSDWQRGRGEFGTNVAEAATVRTLWNQETICLRTEIELRQRPKALVFDVDHDDGVTIWLNGTQLVSNTGYGRNRRYIVMGRALDAWDRGLNLLAARCVNTGGAQYVDLEVTALGKLPRGVRTQPELQAALTSSLDGANKVRRELFAAFRPPALLLQGELDEEQQRVRIAPADLREIAWWIATDLSIGSSGGSVKADSNRMARLGDLLIRGRASSVGQDGWQTITARVQNRREPDRSEDSKRYVQRFVVPHVWYGFDGELTIRRKLGAATPTPGKDRQRVVEFESRLDGRILQREDKRWKKHAATVAQHEVWKLGAVRDGQDAEFRVLVSRSIERGIARLKDQIKAPAEGDTKAEAADADRTYHTGRLALALLALVKAGVPPEDPVVAAGYAELRKRRVYDTYSLGNAMMAVSALYAQKSELGDLKRGLLEKPARREPTAADRELLTTWTAELLDNVDDRVDPAYLLRFHYIGAPDYDNSVNQYGLLGLYAAHLCGVEISPQVWEAAANHLLASQSPDGKRRSVTLVDYGTLAQQGDTARAVEFPARVCGWNYKEPKSDGELTPTWGSMTAAGITGLAICEGALRDYPKLRRNKLFEDITRARRDGFAWLAEHMTLRCHAGAIERQPRWFYYYTYSLERAALLNGIALIQDRDWYFEAAMVLALAQLENGDWPGELVAEGQVETNAMALLTLIQSTRPVITEK